ncbi:unnamed protein product [Rhizoctonia solani]|uniref:Altered inheritance of mitochondria protein 6 n=1 Tax=Rhizoctonia solani TaxID=456999 RepID=A0A8H3DCC2_9AGAM|nr:unnamed protein product [Rhizoctonia solani]
MSRSPEPNSGAYLTLRQRARKSKPSERPSPVKALAPPVFLTFVGLVMWPPGFSVMRRLVITGLGVVASVSPSLAYQTIDEAIADWKNQPQSTYPTEFTRGIIPKGIHSHNDYWRDVPLFSAIAVGAISVEADVWLWNDELYVGHDPSSLSSKRTFSSLYVSPLLSILKQQNPTTSFPYTNNTRNGVFDTTSDQTLYLFVDVKTGGNTTWPLVIKQLEPLRAGGWLSYWDAEAGSLHPGAVTVIGTGNTPFDQIQAHTTPHRDAFYDAPITSFSSGSSGEYNSSLVVIASGSLAQALGGPMAGGTFNDTQRATLTSQIQGAHAAGVKVRYWETPGWPLSKRDYVWKTLEELGVDFLNADDLEAAAGLKEICMSSDKDAGATVPVMEKIDEVIHPLIPEDQKPVEVVTTKPKAKLSATTIIPIWIVLSSSVIIYNNYLYNTLNFKYPVFLVTFHLFFAAIGTRVLQRTTNLLDGVKDVSMSRDVFVRAILPIGLLFSGSLIMSNKAYLYLSVSYIQMLKAFTPVAILLISFAFRIQDPNRRLVAIVLMISGGVSLASYGELKFDMFGFTIQALAVVFEASRLVMIQLLLHGMKMDPLVSLHYYAPVCAAINLLILPFTEGLEPFYHLAEIGPLILLSNAAVAFLLNVAAVFLIGVGSGLVLTLAGVFKDILLISGSVLLFGNEITPLQVFGYSIALGGLVAFKTTGGK